MTLQVTLNKLGILFVLFLFSTSCATISTYKSMEPHAIVIRNSSLASLKIVTLREAKLNNNNKGLRFGSISPVPIGSDQTVIRPSSAPPLPKTVEVYWVDDMNRDYFHTVDLELFNRSKSWQGNKTLVFDIQPSGIVKVFNQEYKPSL